MEVIFIPSALGKRTFSAYENGFGAILVEGRGVHVTVPEDGIEFTDLSACSNDLYPQAHFSNQHRTYEEMIAPPRPSEPAWLDDLPPINTQSSTTTATTAASIDSFPSSGTSPQDLPFLTHSGQTSPARSPVLTRASVPTCALCRRSIHDGEQQAQPMPLEPCPDCHRGCCPACFLACARVGCGGRSCRSCGVERDVGRPALVPLCDGCATEGVSEVEMDRAVEVMERREERGGRQVGARVKVER